MTKLKFQSIIQYEFDTDTNRTRVLKAFTTPIGSAAKNRQRGKDKLSFKGSSTDDEEVIL